MANTRAQRLFKDSSGCHLAESTIGGTQAYDSTPVDFGTQGDLMPEIYIACSQTRETIIKALDRKVRKQFDKKQNAAGSPICSLLNATVSRGNLPREKLSRS